MGILLAFAPFLVYVVVERLASVPVALIAATITSAALLIRDALSRTRGMKILEAGTFLLFGGLAVYAYFSGVQWSIPAIRLRVDAGLLLIVLVSIAIRRPFTLQYAREQVAREFWSSPDFTRTNYVITVVWAAAFAVLVAADLIMLYPDSADPIRHHCHDTGNLGSCTLDRLVSRTQSREGGRNLTYAS